MKKIVIYILLIFLNLNIANSNERSEKEIKLGVFLDDLVDIGSFEKINFSPKGMFLLLVFDVNVLLIFEDFRCFLSSFKI